MGTMCIMMSSILLATLQFEHTKIMMKSTMWMLFFVQDGAFYLEVSSCTVSGNIHVQSVYVANVSVYVSEKNLVTISGSGY